MTSKPSKETAPRQKRDAEGEPLDPHGDIGLKLKALYAEVEREPIPPGLLDLLEQLAEAEKRARK